MKTLLPFFLTASIASAVVTGEIAIPEPFPEARYQALKSKSPFALATAVVPQAPPDRSFADGWYLSGVSRFDGKDFVTIRSRDASVQFSLHGDSPNELDGPGKGIKLKNVEWSPLLGSTSATLEKDGQIAKVPQLDQAETAGAMPPAMISPGGGMPRAAYPNAAGLPQGNAARNMPQSGQRVTIPRPSHQPAAPQPVYQVAPGVNPAGGGVRGNSPAVQQSAGGAVPAEGRRRIRVINSAPTQQ